MSPPAMRNDPERRKAREEYERERIAARRELERLAEEAQKKGGKK